MQFDYKTMPLLKQNAASITGPGLLYPGQSGTYTITNYDDFHTWAVSSDKGTVSRNGEKITLNIAAGEATGVAYIHISRNGINDSVPVMIAPNGVAKPVVLTPVNGAINVVESPTITLSAFSTYPANFDTEESVSMRLFDDQSNVVWQLLDQPSDTVFTVPPGVLSPAKTYRPQGRYKGKLLGYSEWSDLGVSFVTVDNFGPAGVGAVYEGGIVVGQDDGYWVIVAPATMRDKKVWGLYGIDTILSNTPDVSNPVDQNTSKYNTDVLVSGAYSAMVGGQGNTGSPAAEYARSNGYDLPNIQDLFLIYSNRVMIDAADVSGGVNTLSMIASESVNSLDVALSSSERNSTHIPVLRLSSGSREGGGKYINYWVIPVRRVPV